jgi:hypothetical protein
MGKLIFEQTYRQCLNTNAEYLIDYLVPIFCNGCSYGPCQQPSEIREFDLTTAFKLIVVEKKDDKFIPDLTLKTESGDNVLYIEIAVTHDSSSEKINSGKKIIEFAIKSESDFHILKKTYLHTKNDLVTFHNFTPRNEYIKMYDSCRFYVDYFQVSPNGKCVIDSIELYNFDKLKNKINFYIKEVHHKSSNIFIEEVERAVLDGIKVKNCFACRYHAQAKNRPILEDRPKAIFCKTYKTYCTSNHAAECDRYLPDPKIFTHT